MRFLANLSIRNKIAGIILVTTILSLGSAFALVYVRTVKQFEQYLMDSVRVIAQAAGDYSAFGLAFEDDTEARAALENLKEFPNVIEAQLYDTSEKFFVAFTRSGIPSRIHNIEKDSEELRGGFVHIFAPVTWQEDVYGTIYVRGSTADLEQQKRTLLFSMVTTLFGVVILAVIFAYYLQGFISNPILHLARQAEKISDDADYSIRVERPGNDEIGVLYDGFNNMLAQIKVRQEELERSNRDLDQFAYVASHDLKAPLRAIATLSGWLEEDLAGHLSGTAKEQMQLLRSRVQRMDALIEGVLRYSRVGRMESEGEDVDVGELLAEQIELLAPQPGFEVVVETGMPTILTRRLRLSQVFSNLINNAIKYHDRKDGKVTISAHEIEPGLYEFAVTDDGPGIPPQHHERVFTMFQTLQPRDEMESTGLGLALVKKLVEEEGGKVSLESAVGQGAIFRFTWPVMQKATSGPLTG